MKTLIKVITPLILIVSILYIPIVAIASDISGASYYGTVLATNNGTLTENVAANFTLSTDDLISSGQLNSSANNVAMRNTSGVDIAFMPGYGSNPWITYYDSIMATTSKNSYIYTGNVTGGTTRWFPGATGGIVTENASLRIGADGGIYLHNVFLDTTQVGENVTTWYDAVNGGYVISYPSSGTVQASFNYLESATDSSAYRPNAAGDSTNLTPSAGQNYECLGDASDATYVTTTSTAYSQDLCGIPDHTTELGAINSVTCYIRLNRGLGDSVEGKCAIKLSGTTYYGSEHSLSASVATTYNDVFNTSPDTGVAWTWDEIDSMQYGLALKKTGVAVPYCYDVWFVVNYTPLVIQTASITDVPAGVYDLYVIKDSPFCCLCIDSTDTPATTNLTMNAPLFQEDCSSSPFTTIDSNALSVSTDSVVWSSDGYEFDGASGNITVTDAASIRNLSAITVEAWVYARTIGENNGGRIIDKNSGTLMLNFYPGTGLEFVRTRAGSNCDFYNGSGITLNTWCHLVVTFDGTTGAMYKNGVPLSISGGVGAGAYNDDTGDLYIGNRLGDDRTSDGFIPEVRIYNRVLSVAEILQNYNATRYKYLGTGSVSTLSSLVSHNSTSDWIFCPSPAVLFVESVSVSVNGTSTGNWTWSYNNLFYDTTGNGNTMTPSFRTTSSDADVSAELISFQPINLAVADSVMTSEWPDMITDVPDQPDTMYTEEEHPGIFFEPFIDAIWPDDIPIEFFWYPFTFATILGASMLTYYFFSSKGQNGLLIKAIVGTAVMIFWALPGPNVYGMFVVIYKIMFDFGVIVLSKNYSW